MTTATAGTGGAPEEKNLQGYVRSTSSVDQAAVWKWITSQPGFIAERAQDASLTTLERWYYQAKKICQENAQVPALETTPEHDNGDGNEPKAIEVMYLRDTTMRSVGDVYGLPAHRTRRWNMIDEFLLVKVACKGRIMHIKALRVKNEHFVVCDHHVDGVDMQSRGLALVNREDGAGVEELIGMVKM